MKVTKLSVAAIAALAISTAAVAADAPTVYGVMNVEAGSFDSGATVGGKKLGADTQNSRFGIKGALDLEDTDLKAIYQIEVGHDQIGGFSLANTKVRNTFVGLTGDFGTVLAGTHDHPSKLALYQSGAGVFAADTTAKLVQTELRSSPAVAYVSNFSEDITVAVAAVFDGGKNGAAINGTRFGEEPTVADREDMIHFDLGVWGKAGDLKYGVGVIVVDDKLIDDQDPIFQASVGYTIDSFNVGASIQKGTLAADFDATGTPTGLNKTKNDDMFVLLQANADFDGGYFAGVGAQLAMHDNNDKDSTDIGLIGGKKFGKAAKVYLAAKMFDKNKSHGFAQYGAGNVKVDDNTKGGVNVALGLTVGF